MHLRKWQKDNIDKFRAHNHPRDWMMVASVGAGKTFATLNQVEAILKRLDRGFIVIVAPSREIVKTWRDEAKTRFGIELKTKVEASTFAAAVTDEAFDGIVITYHLLLSKEIRDYISRILSARRPIVAVFDEIHHASVENIFGGSILECFANAKYRIALSGTPFRHDGTKISFLSYDALGKVIADTKYTYSQAIAEKICRPLKFETCAGRQKWLDERSICEADFDADLDDQGASRRLYTSLSEDSDLVGELIRKADERLQKFRKATPDAGALLVAIDIKNAEMLARKVRQITGENVTIATSEDKHKDAIATFKNSSAPWIVAVRMVSEGVDIKRLRVLVYATNITRRLTFLQVVGRIVRTRQSEAYGHSYVFLPGDSRLVTHAKEIEADVAAGLRTQKEKGEHSCSVRQAYFEPLGGEGRPGVVIAGGEAFDAELLARAEKIMKEVGSMSTPEKALKFHELMSRNAPVDSTQAAAEVYEDDRPLEEQMRSMRASMNKDVRKMAERAYPNSVFGEACFHLWRRIKKLSGIPSGRKLKECTLDEHRQLLVEVADQKRIYP
jgi:superfamily II DNA or RNA helicase